jgi:hypothetical protein
LALKAVKRRYTFHPESDRGDITTTALPEGDEKDSIPRAGAKKVTITLALDDFIVAEIRKEADKSQKSLNARINAILEKYVKYYKMVELNGAVIIPPVTHQFFINEIDEAKFTAELKRNATDIVAALIVQNVVPLTLDNIIKFTFEEVSISGGVIKGMKKYIDQQDGKTCPILHT